MARTSVVATWAVLALELVVVVAARRRDVANAWEVATGGLYLVPAALAAAAPLGLLGAGVHALLVREDRARRIALAGVGLLFGASAAWLIATGRHFSAPGARAGFAAAVGTVGLLAAWGSHPWLARWRAASPRAFGLTTVAVMLALSLANRFVLVRLYAPFHAALAVLTLTLAPVAALSLRERARSRPPAGLRRLLSVALPALWALCVVLAAPASAALGRFDNFRLVLGEHAPLLGQAVAIAARVSPPPPIEEVPSCLTGGACGPETTGGTGPSLAGRDVVLVTVDALRADHVGAYGYGRPTTPHLDALAREGAVFEQAYCATPHTSYSIASLLTGKYMRPLLLQGVGATSETLATYLQKYGFRTAAFYPPAVFFIDRDRFAPFEQAGFGFEYRKVEFMEGRGRVEQVERYLGTVPGEQRILLWVHLFGPHEPYESHPEHPFGERDVDRYDSEIAAADHTLGEVVRLVRARRPGAAVVVTADHGEEFGEHGGRYHGTTVYEEQTRVPLVISVPGVVAPRRVQEVVQTIDIVPTLLAGLGVPPSPRLRGRNLGPLLDGSRPAGPGMAFAETEESALLAEGSHRLVCARKLGACRLYDVARDPRQQVDVSATERERFERLRRTLQGLGASHGRFELSGLRAERAGGWPGPILRGLAGDADAAPELSALLDDADREIRRKAAELLFDLRRSETLPALRLALARDEDPEVQSWSALSLTRMGEGAPRVLDLLHGDDLRWKRLAALALAESGDARGVPLLIDWWQRGGRNDYGRALELLSAFSRSRSKDAVWPLVQALGDVRLRPRIAETLATIGDDAARGPLAAALGVERYQTSRKAIAEAIVALKGKEELVRPLVRFLGVPDPLEGGLGLAAKAGILEHVGGPDTKPLRSLIESSNVGVLVPLVVPRGGNGTGLRLLVRARAEGSPGEVRVGTRLSPLEYDTKGVVINSRKAPQIHDRDFVRFTVPGDGKTIELHAPLPAALGGRPGRALELVAYAERQVTLEALAVVPLADELPPPPPKPWAPGDPSDGAPDEAGERDTPAGPGGAGVSKGVEAGSQKRPE